MNAPLSTKLPERFWEYSLEEQDKFIENWIRKAWQQRTELSGQPATGLAVGLKAKEAGAA